MAKILIIDDEKNIRKTLSEFLSAEGHQPTSSETADGMIEFIRDNPVDIVICDIILPKIRGTDFITELHQTHPEIKSILITGQPSIDTVITGIRSQAFDYLAKPITKTMLLKTVNKAAQIKASEDLTLKLRTQNQSFQERLEELINKKNSALSQILKKILTFQKDDATSIASKLHDTIGQDLISLKLYLQSTFKQIDNQQETKEEQATIINEINSLIEETRRIAQHLNPISLQSMGLQNAIQALIRQIETDKNIHIIHEPQNVEQIIQAKWDETKYQIISRALSLLVTHANCSSINIKSEMTNNQLCLTFTHDGKTSPPSTVRFVSIDGCGLEFILLEELVKSYGGSAKCHNKQLRIKLPI